jgi:hypothetical protein
VKWVVLFKLLLLFIVQKFDDRRERDGLNCYTLTDERERFVIYFAFTFQLPNPEWSRFTVSEPAKIASPPTFLPKS